MDKITLKQLLQYYDFSKDPADRIQVVTQEQDWDCAAELFADSGILDLVANCIVSDLRCEESFRDGKPIIRVMIDVP